MIALIGIPVAFALVYGIPAARAPGPDGSPLSLEASLSDRKLTLRRDGEIIKTYDVAIGAPSFPTPTGQYNIRKMVWNPRWTPPKVAWAAGKTPKAPGTDANPMKTVKIFFQEPDYYIHGTDQVESLGSAASHGCLRLDPVDAAELAIRVMESSGAKKDSTWYQNAIEKGQTRTVILPQKVEMIISG